MNYLKDLRHEYGDCTIIGDRGYHSAGLQQDMFPSAGIKLEVPCRANMKHCNHKPIGGVKHALA